jgi:choline dehydrogenase-like flavoprotein
MRLDGLPRIAIVGGGPTGISLSRSLVSKGFTVALFEAGDEFSEGSELTRESYEFRTSSLMPEGVHKLGGGSNYWIGRIGEFLPLDFKKLGDVRPQSFPIDYEALRPFYLEAFELLTGKSESDSDLVQSEIDRLGIHLSPNLELRIIRYSNKKFFQDSVQMMRKNPMFELYLNHRCLSIRKSQLSAHKESYELDFSFLGESVTKVFDLVVLCCGAIQSPILLLNSPQIQQHYNSSLIGTHLMEHFDGFVGEIYWNRRKHSPQLKRLVLNRNRVTKNSSGLGVAIKVSESIRERECAINLHLEVVPKQRFYFFDPEKENRFPSLSKFLYFSERVMRKILSESEKILLSVVGKSVYSVWVKSEILPSLPSNVHLSEGARKTCYEHVVSDKSKHEFLRALKILGQEMSSAGLGELRARPSILDGSDMLYQGKNWHPMGTLRMGTDCKESLCDSNLKLFGADNIYVADASVFPCGSNANPTFTALSLGLRLSNHLGNCYGVK